jgi:hypothetical protein
MTLEQLEAMVVGRSDNGDNPISSERDLWRAIINESIKLYEVKEIDINVTANPTYISENFDNTGLGINKMIGFAICNGNNGTRDRNGLTSIGYGTSYPSIGATGGSKDAVLLEHTHNSTALFEPMSDLNSTNPHIAAYRLYGGNNEYSLQGTSKTPNSGKTSVAGVDGTGKNLPPYIVTLMIQRIS